MSADDEPAMFMGMLNVPDAPADEVRRDSIRWVAAADNRPTDINAKAQSTGRRRWIEGEGVHPILDGDDSIPVAPKHGERAGEALLEKLVKR